MDLPPLHNHHHHTLTYILVDTNLVLATFPNRQWYEWTIVSRARVCRRPRIGESESFALVDSRVAAKNQFFVPPVEWSILAIAIAKFDREFETRDTLTVVAI